MLPWLLSSVELDWVGSLSREMRAEGIPVCYLECIDHTGNLACLLSRRQQLVELARFPPSDSESSSTISGAQCCKLHPQ